MISVNTSRVHLLFRYNDPLFLLIILPMSWVSPATVPITLRPLEGMASSPSAGFNTWKAVSWHPRRKEARI